MGYKGGEGSKLLNHPEFFFLLVLSKKELTRGPLRGTVSVLFWGGWGDFTLIGPGGPSSLSNPAPPPNSDLVFSLFTFKKENEIPRFSKELN